jgi:hypothetical protein
MREIVILDRDVRQGVDPGPAPILQWLPIEALRVDDSYQRDLKRENWTAIRKIAATFLWSRFSPVFVAPIEGGLYAIIDGQHRTHAAALCGIASVPCQIVQMSREEQAEAFAAVNGMATRVTLWNLYRASRTAGIEWAVRIQATAEAAGCNVAENNASTKAKKPGEIYAIEGFRRIVDKRSAFTVAIALKVLRGCRGWRDEAVYWEAGILFPVLEALCDRPELLERDDFQAAFEKWPLWKQLDDITDSVKSAVRSGSPFAPKREQLQRRLAAWMLKYFRSDPELTTPPASVAVPAQRQVPAGVDNPELRRQHLEAQERRRRLGF